MTLLEHISDMARRQELAAAVGSHPDYLWQIATARRKAGHALARAIEEATEGKVSRCELRPDIFGQPPAAASNDQQKAA